MQTARSFLLHFFITTLRANEVALPVESVTVTKQPGQQWLSLPAPSAALLESRCNEISLVFVEVLVCVSTTIKVQLLLCLSCAESLF